MIGVSMEIKSSIAPAVNRRPRNNRGFLHREISDVRTRMLFLRLLGYARGAFMRGAHYKLWSELRRSFAETSGYSEKHLERQFPRFRRWCEEFKFERIRLGRSWQIKIAPSFGVLTGPVTGAEIRARLVGAVLTYAKRTGSAKVDAEFLRKFADISKLPAAGVIAVWRGLTNLPGCRCRWRGAGPGRKFVVFRDLPENSSSHPQTPSGLSSPFGGEENKNSRPRAAAPGAPDQKSGSLRSQPPGPGDDPSAAQSKSEDPSTSQGAAGRPALGGPTFSRAFATAAPPPFQTQNRWISGRKLLALASWLACVPIRGAHAGRERVAWRFAHSRNFALRALRDGFDAGAIVQAWAIGCQRSHDDALDRDRLPGGGYASQREPSATVVYAWQELLRDQRPAAQRWAEFFARPPRAKLRAAAGGSGADASSCGEARRAPRSSGAKSDGGARLTPGEAAERLRELRAIVAPKRDAEAFGAAREITLTAGQLAEFLRGRGMSLANFNALPWSTRAALVRRAIARQAEDGHSQKPQ